ncbi:MAG: OmpA family protein [Chitinophagales bacterium]|nr:OmpA family protein [Chitinophagales bacterium]
MNFWNRLGWLGKTILISIIVIPVFIFGRKYLYESGTIGKDTTESVTLEKAAEEENKTLSTIPSNYKTVGLKQLPMPSKDPVNAAGRPHIKYLGMAWNAQAPIAYANGGTATTKGSLMDQAGIHFEFVRQDSYDKMKEALLDFANAYKNDPNTTQGAQLVAIMGDGLAAFAPDLNSKLKQIDPSYGLKAIYVAGFSYGEDKFIGPNIWRLTPDSARGGICVVYPKDGDHNLAIKWASDNGIAVNPDFETYDPSALNFASAEDFLDASRKYQNKGSYIIDRPEVVNGKKTGKNVKKQIESVATWTPADVDIFTKSTEDIVTLLSTRENSQQMPCLMIGLNKHLENNRQTIEKMIWAMAQAGDQVKSYDAALTRASEIQTDIYDAETPEYWKKYFVGVNYKTSHGRNVLLGGSRAANLADNAETFGIISGTPNRYADVYNLFGGYMSKLYPQDLPVVEDINTLVDLSFLRAVYEDNKNNLTAPDKAQIAKGEIVDEFARKDYSIEFNSGSAEFTQRGLETLNDLYLSLSVSDMKIQISGHTDSDGDEDANMELSQRRADAVKYWLIRKKINVERFTGVVGYGESQPKEENNTVAGKAKNRRVEIVTGI